MTVEQFSQLKAGDKIKIDGYILTVNQRRLCKDGYVFMSTLYPPKMIEKVN